MELAKYHAMAALESRGQPDLSADPLEWWKNYAAELPTLASLARKYLAIPASSAAVERMFSYTGNRVGKKDTRLDDENLLALMHVRALARFVERYGS